MIARKTINSLKTSNCFPFPQIVQLEITNKCPLNCVQCYKNISTENEMDIATITASVDECIENGTTMFVLNGGEPLLHRNFGQIIEYLTLRQVRFNVFTSGIGLNDEVIKCAKKGYMRLFVSLNGSTEEINSRSRDGYKYAIGAIDTLMNSSAPFYINWVARHDNVRDFPAMVELAIAKKVKGLSVISNKLINNRYIDSPLNSEDYIFFVDCIKREEKNIPILIESCYSVLGSLFPVYKTAKYYGCMAGLYGCNITVDGNFMPCTQLNYREAYANISDYWHNSKVLERLRSISKNDLSHCNLCNKTGCRFCRAMSRESHDDFSLGYKSCPVREIKIQPNA